MSNLKGRPRDHAAIGKDMKTCGNEQLDGSSSLWKSHLSGMPLQSFLHFRVSPDRVALRHRAVPSCSISARPGSCLPARASDRNRRILIWERNNLTLSRLSCRMISSVHLGRTRFCTALTALCNVRAASPAFQPFQESRRTKGKRFTDRLWCLTGVSGLHGVRAQCRIH